MTKSKSTLLGLLAILTVPVTAVAQGRGVVAGTVRAQDGSPLPGARVTVTGTNLRSQSGQDGTYRIVAVPAGSHDISAIMLGYSPQSQRVVVTDAPDASRYEARLVGLHGSLTPREMRIPVLVD